MLCFVKMFDTEEWPGLEKKYLKQFKPTHMKHRGVSFGEHGNVVTIIFERLVVGF